mmetsp:Transcript_35762/g.65853  ORF Transcript_35762/g.65853 Transcript_35762/m.65853 type:complete len:237 (-) Transcript_35762:1222-1932(-)
MHRPSCKPTEVVLHRLAVKMYTKGIKELAQISNFSYPVHFLINMKQPRIRLHIRTVHGQDPVEPLEGFRPAARVQIRVLPELVHASPLLLVLSHRVRVESDAPLRGVVVVPVRETSQSDGYFLPLEDHGQMLIVRHVNDEMPPSEGKSGSPVRFDGGRARDSGYPGRLRKVTQVPTGALAIIVGLAHDGPRLVEGHTLLLVEPSIGIVVQVNAQHRHLIFGRLPLIDDINVPILDE